MSYVPEYDRDNRCTGVRRLADGAVVGRPRPGESPSRAWRAFLAWDAAQSAPLDLSDLSPPSPEELRARRRAAARALVPSGDPLVMLVRAVVQEVMASLAETRVTLNAAADAAQPRPGRAIPPPLVNRTWEQVVAAVLARIEAGQADPPA